MKKSTSTPSDRELACLGPRDDKPPGGVEWSWHTLESLKRKWERVETTYQDWDKVLSEAEEYEIWEVIPPEAPYGSLEKMLEANLKITESQAKSRDLFELRHVTQDRSFQLEVLSPLRHPGRPPEDDNGDNGVYKHIIRGSTNANYLTRRIARDRPDILERMKAGEFRSVRQAAIEAGIVKPEKRISIPIHPERAARSISNHFSPEQVSELVDRLTNGNR